MTFNLSAILDELQEKIKSIVRLSYMHTETVNELNMGLQDLLSYSLSMSGIFDDSINNKLAGLKQQYQANVIINNVSKDIHDNSVGFKRAVVEQQKQTDARVNHSSQNIYKSNSSKSALLEEQKPTSLKPNHVPDLVNRPHVKKLQPKNNLRGQADHKKRKSQRRVTFSDMESISGRVFIKQKWDEKLYPTLSTNWQNSGANKSENVLETPGPIKNDIGHNNNTNGIHVPPKREDCNENSIFAISHDASRNQTTPSHGERFISSKISHNPSNTRLPKL
jgi:hypothetical protein